MSQGDWSSVEIFCVSHRQDLLDGLGDIAVSKILLDELEIADKYKGNALAENRFFFASLLEESKAKVVGLVSARWDQRALGKNVPKLQNLSKYASKLDTNQVFGPDVIYVRSYLGLRRWLAYSDFVLPGIRPLLLEVIAREKSRRSKLRTLPHEYGHAVMGGQVLLNKSRMMELQAFMRLHINTVFDQYGLYPDYKYGCIRCGFESSEGIGRYNRSRLLAMFGERLLALFFILRPEIELMEFTHPNNSQHFVKMRGHVRSSLNLLLPWVTLIKIRRYALRLTGLDSSCDHSWRGQPDADN